MRKLKNEYKNLELSHATLREEDLLPCFMNFLNEVKRDCNIVRKVESYQEEVDNIENFDTEDVYMLLNEDIFGLLNDIAPAGCYFGASEGDGSLFGFWQID